MSLELGGYSARSAATSSKTPSKIDISSSFCGETHSDTAFELSLLSARRRETASCLMSEYLFVDDLGDRTTRVSSRRGAAELCQENRGSLEAVEWAIDVLIDRAVHQTR